MLFLIPASLFPWWDADPGNVFCYRWGENKQANEDDHKLSADFFAKLPKLISDQVIRPNNAVVFGNGLDGVADGFQEYRDGNISNFKIVYKL